MVPPLSRVLDLLETMLRPDSVPELALGVSPVVARRVPPLMVSSSLPQKP